MALRKETYPAARAKQKNEAQMCTANSTILNIRPANAMTRKKKTMDVHLPMATLFHGKIVAHLSLNFEAWHERFLSSCEALRQFSNLVSARGAEKI